jgi:glycerate kinase
VSEVLRRHCLVAPDSFKGTFTAAQVAAAIGRGLEAAGEPPPDLCPVADGGEGTLSVLLTALGGETGGAAVTGPLGVPLQAGFAVLEGGSTAVVEVAAASGMGLVPDDQRNADTAWRASSRGTGELIAAAARTGAQVVLVAAGGSATTDGGAGAITAIADAGGLGGTTLVVLCDVRTPYADAASVFAPQKGADPATVTRLAQRLDAHARSLPRDPRHVPMSGAAGGLAGGLWAAFGAHLEAGAPFVLDAVDFDARLRGAHALIVGEGRLDAQTLEGKILGVAAARARVAGIACHAIVGQHALDAAAARTLGLCSVREAASLDAIERGAQALVSAL